MLSFTITLIVLISVLVGALIGWARGLKKSAVKLVAVLLSAILAFFISAPISKLIVNDELVNWIISSLNITETYNELIAASPAMEEVITALPAAIISPILFISLFYFVRLIMVIPCTIVNTSLNILEIESAGIKAIGIPIGAVQGFITAMIPVIVLTGFLGIGDGVIDAMKNEMPAEEIAEIEEIDGYIEEIKKDPVVYLFFTEKKDDSDSLNVNNNRVLASDVAERRVKNSLFDSLSKFKVKDSKAYLSEELVSISNAVTKLSPLMEGGEGGWTSEDIDAIERFTLEFGNSIILSEVASELVAGACDKWSQGEPFIGITFSSLGDELDPIVYALFGTLKNSTSDTLKVDLSSFVDMLRVLDKHQLLNKLGGDASSIFTDLKGELITDLLTVLSSNERFNVVIPEVTNLSIKMLATTLKLPENVDEVYQTVISDMTSGLNDALNGEVTEESVASLSANVMDSLKSGGIEVTDDMANVVAEAMIDAFANHDGKITEENVQKYFDDYAIIYGAVSNESEDQVKNESEETILSSTTGSSKLSGNYDITNMSYSEKLAVLSEIGVLDTYESKYGLKNLNENSPLYIGMTAGRFVDYIISIYNYIDNNYDKVSDSSQLMTSLKSADDIVTNKVTVESLKVASGSCNLSEEEIKNIGEGFDNINKFIQSVESMGGDISLENIGDFDIEAMGKALDALKGTSLFAEAIDPLAGAVVNNITGSNADIAGTMSEGKVSYESLMGTVKSTAGVINSIQNSNATENDKNNAILSLFETINKDNADVIIAIIDKDFIINQGFGAEYADATVTILKIALREMSLLEKEEHDTEAAKIRYILELATASQSKEVYGEKGIFKSTDEIIFMGIESKVVSAVLEELTSDNKVDPLGIASKISDSDKSNIVADLNEYYNKEAQNSSEKELAILSKKIKSITILLNLPM